MSDLEKEKNSNGGSENNANEILETLEIKETEIKETESKETEIKEVLEEKTSENKSLNETVEKVILKENKELDAISEAIQEVIKGVSSEEAEEIRREVAEMLAKTSDLAEDTNSNVEHKKEILNKTFKEDIKPVIKQEVREVVKEEVKPVKEIKEVEENKKSYNNVVKPDIVTRLEQKIKVEEAKIEELQAKINENRNSLRENKNNIYEAKEGNKNENNEEMKLPVRKKGTWSKLIASSLIVSVFGGASMGVGYGYATSVIATPEPMAVAPTPVVARPVATENTDNNSGDVRSDGYSAIEIIKAVKPAVVSIATQTSTEKQYYGAFSIPYETEGAGSGIIFYSDSEKVAIATNNHVIDGATSIYVSFADSEEEEEISIPAKVVGTKAESDLAVITMDWEDLRENGVENISIAVFGNSDELEVGDPVVAIGNAVGMGISATDGIISMTEQTIYIDESQLAVLQTSAAINGGNSGGALVNDAGEIIGINTAKYNSTKTEGIGYAIPSNEIIPIIEELLLNGTQPKPFIGITGASITDENSNLYRLPVGALIMEVTEDGPAHKAGILSGDIITEFDGKTIMNMESLIDIVNEVEVGSEVNVHVIRNGNESVDLTLIVGDKNL